MKQAFERLLQNLSVGGAGHEDSVRFSARRASHLYGGLAGDSRHLADGQALLQDQTFELISAGERVEHREHLSEPFRLRTRLVGIGDGEGATL